MSSPVPLRCAVDRLEAAPNFPAIQVKRPKVQAPQLLRIPSLRNQHARCSTRTDLQLGDLLYDALPSHSQSMLRPLVRKHSTFHSILATRQLINFHHLPPSIAVVVCCKPCSLNLGLNICTDSVQVPHPHATYHVVPRASSCPHRIPLQASISAPPAFNSEVRGRGVGRVRGT